jgi:DNA invertase Pin-like site-specific DNA recombinase
MTRTLEGAVIYARVSDKKQAEAEVSVPAQIEAGQRRAELLKAHVERVFTDDGRSAYKANNRPQFEAAIEYATTRNCKYFITWSSSRFARNKIEAALYKRELDHAGVRLFYLDMDIDRDTDAGWLLDGVLEIFDEMKSRQTSVDTKRSMIRNAEQGYFCGGRSPFGFVTIPAPDNPKRKKLVPLPEEAVRLREVFELRKMGLGGRSLAERYNSLGIRYRGRSWTKDTTLNVLRNEAAIGQTIFNRIDRRTNKQRPREEWIIVQTHEPVIDMPTWLEVQSQMHAAAEDAQGRGTSLSEHVLSGLLKCVECGGALTIETASGNGGRYSYYSCRRGKRNGQCDTRRWPAEALDTFMVDAIFSRILDRETVAETAQAMIEGCGEWQRDQLAKRKALAQQAQSLQQRNGKLYEVLEAMGRDAPNLGDIAGRLRANNAEIKALEVQIADMDAEEAPAVDLDSIDLDEVASELRSLFTEKASVARLRSFLRGFIRGIVLRGDEVEIEYEPAALLATAGPVHRLRNWRPVAASLRTQRLALGLPESVLAMGWARRRLTDVAAVRVG